MITLTDTAASKVKELLDAEGAADLALRVAVRPGGCSGFSYEMFFDGDIAADDEQAEYSDGVTVVVDPASAQLLAGRHARLQGRPEPVGVRHHEPQRRPAPAAAARASPDRPRLIVAVRRRLASGRAPESDLCVGHRLRCAPLTSA